MQGGDGHMDLQALPVLPREEVTLHLEQGFIQDFQEITCLLNIQFIKTKEVIKIYNLKNNFR